MKKLLSVKKIKLFFALLVLALVVWLAYTAADPYKGLVTQAEISIDPTLKTQLEQQLTTYQAALEAQLQSDQEVDLNLYLLIASRAKSLGDYALARETYEAYFEQHAINPVAWNNYGGILMKMQDYNPAADAYQRAAELSPEVEEYYRDFAGALEMIGDREEEILHVYEVAVEQVGQTHSLMVALAQWYEEQGDCHRAIEHYEVAINVAQSDALIDSIQSDLDALQSTCE